MLDQNALDTLFLEARTHNAWTDKPVPEDLLRRLHDLARMGPTSANCCPGRFKFIASAEGKAKLKPLLMGGNVDKTMAAPVTVLIGYDLAFHDHLPKLFPHTDAKSWFEGNDALIEETAVRNGTLQGAYLMLAARALGLDCGPMSGFDRIEAGKVFWPDEKVEANFLCNLGYGDEKALFPRSPRFAFDEVCEIL